MLRNGYKAWEPRFVVKPRNNFRETKWGGSPNNFYLFLNGTELRGASLAHYYPPPPTTRRLFTVPLTQLNLYPNITVPLTRGFSLKWVTHCCTSSPRRRGTDPSIRRTSAVSRRSVWSSLARSTRRSRRRRTPGSNQPATTGLSLFLLAHDCGPIASLVSWTNRRDLASDAGQGRTTWPACTRFRKGQERRSFIFFEGLHSKTDVPFKHRLIIWSMVTVCFPNKRTLNWSS